MTRMKSDIREIVCRANCLDKRAKSDNYIFDVLTKNDYLKAYERETFYIIDGGKIIFNDLVEKYIYYEE